MGSHTQGHLYCITASCMGICVGSQLDPTGSHRIPHQCCFCTALSSRLACGHWIEDLLSRILWDPSRIPWDPTPRGIYTASCMGICVGSQLDPTGSHARYFPTGKAAIPCMHFLLNNTGRIIHIIRIIQYIVRIIHNT